jgi:heptosyltransferase-2
VLRRFLVVQTAFIGDVVLTLPLVQQLHASFPGAQVTFVAIPAAAEVLRNHPAIHEIIPYDKRGGDAGIAGIVRLARRLRNGAPDVAIVPHRSLRSAILTRLAAVPRRIGFSTSAAPWLFTDNVAYEKNAHEIDRNLSLLKPLGIKAPDGLLPDLYPGDGDKESIKTTLLTSSFLPALHRKTLIALAPGSVWNTKRWPGEHFIALGRLLIREGISLVLIGGREDAGLCADIAETLGRENALNTAGQTTLLQSAELLRQCVLLVSNDSAPMHLAVGVRTPVVAIFGATVPGFGFAPRGKHDVIIGLDGLACRPCSIHGGRQCPIRTFVCMNDLSPEVVFARVRALAESLKLTSQ